MTGDDALERGRDAFDRRVWSEACEALGAADASAPLAADDLSRLAVAATLCSRDLTGERSWERAHRGYLDAGDAPAAARCAFWLAQELVQRGEVARAGGWLARGRRVLAEHGQDCVEHGYLLVPEALQRLSAGDAEGALAIFREAAVFAERFVDADLAAFTRLGQGHALTMLGRVADGLAMLDEVMIAVDGELSPLVVGIAYCVAISICHELFDVRRAQEWTAALTRWCEAQPDLVPFRGECLVYRAELLQLRGAWSEAVIVARRAGERLAHPSGQQAVGAAHYCRGELHRLRGEFAEAEAAYREASAHGRAPDPGLALLSLGQGRSESAAAAIRRVIEEASDPLARSPLLPALVEIMLAVGDVAAARRAADELLATAERIGAPLLHAYAGRAAGAVLLAEGNPRAALTTLRSTASHWQDLDAPYEAARHRALIGFACRALGDEESAALELGGARRVFEALGAKPELERLDSPALARPGAVDSPAGRLSAREREVLRLVAAGHTNREIGAALTISEHTVARHVQNIFAKLDVSSRTAASAYAFEHDLV